MSRTGHTARPRGDPYVRSVRAVVTLDPHNGNVAWEGTTSRDAKLVYHFLAEAYVAAVDVRQARKKGQRAGRRKQLTAYFYDRKDRSGIIPEAYGMANLGTFGDGKTVALRDHALIVQNAETLHFFTDKTVPNHVPGTQPGPAKTNPNSAGDSDAPARAE